MDPVVLAMTALVVCVGILAFLAGDDWFRVRPKRQRMEDIARKFCLEELERTLDKAKGPSAGDDEPLSGGRMNKHSLTQDAAPRRPDIPCTQASIDRAKAERDKQRAELALDLFAAGEIQMALRLGLQAEIAALTKGGPQ